MTGEACLSDDTNEADVSDETGEADDPDSRSRFRQLLARPAGQPRWSRPALLIVATLAALSYSWGIRHESLELFYAAAARSMSLNAHNFFFGAVDPAATVTLDKLPGAVWFQAISVKLLGYSNASVVLPQIVEGVLTVLVLHRAVRRLAGPVAAIVAALTLALSPAATALNRGNIGDSLMILLIVCAANSAVSYQLGGRSRSLVLAGFFVGLAFQAKMMEAWIVILPIGAMVLISCWVPVRQRLAQLAAALSIMVLTSISWMTIVSVVPAASRPAVDGSTYNSLFQQVFVYNGFGRFGSGGLVGLRTAPFLLLNAHRGHYLGGALPGPSWNRLLSGPLASDGAWLLPAAAVIAVALLARSARFGRRDPIVAATVLWSAWVLIFFVVMSSIRGLNAYYVAVLCPGVAALVGIGVAEWMDHVLAATEHRRAPFLNAALVSLLSLGYGAWLLPGGTGGRSALIAAALALAALAVVVFGVSARPAAELPVRVPLLGALLVVAMTALPAAATFWVAASGAGPFDTPFETQGRLYDDETNVDDAQVALATLADTLARQASLGHYRYVAAIDTSGDAAAYIAASGKEFLPIGGYRGGLPAPTLAELQHLVRTGQLGMAILPVRPASGDPRVQWFLSACLHGPPPLTDPAFVYVQCPRAARAPVLVGPGGAGSGSLNEVIEEAEQHPSDPSHEG